MGYRVTLFEASERLGGMMFHGIPEFRLSRSIIEKEIDKIVQRGVEIKTHAPLTPDFGLAELKAQGFEAVFIALGTQKGRELNIEGSQLDGVIKAIDYLLNINNGYRVELGRRCWWWVAGWWLSTRLGWLCAPHWKRRTSRSIPGP
jgi:NADPH-dependent glutamate synthase beta subunit-like oxidoreductase